MTHERCGTIIKACAYPTICMRPIDHDRECRPLRSDIMNAIENLEKQADVLSAWVIERDSNYELWPKEGPDA